MALRFDKNLRYTFARLARFSEMGAPVPSERPRLKGLRKWRVDDFERYLIFYLPRSYGIEILHVKHSLQNWWKQLGMRVK